MPNKIRGYLDTSVIISNLAIQEVNECAEEKRKTLLSYLAEMEYERCSVDEKTEELANYKTINGVRQICFKKNLNRIIDICSPYVLLENE